MKVDKFTEGYIKGLLDLYNILESKKADIVNSGFHKYSKSEKDDILGVLDIVQSDILILSSDNIPSIKGDVIKMLEKVEGVE